MEGADNFYLSTFGIALSTDYGFRALELPVSEYLTNKVSFDLFPM